MEALDAKVDGAFGEELVFDRLRVEALWYDVREGGHWYRVVAYVSSERGHGAQRYAANLSGEVL